jgi:hypothetical protein
MFFSPQRAIRELGLPQSDLTAAMRDAAEWFLTAGARRGTVAA